MSTSGIIYGLHRGNASVSNHLPVLIIGAGLAGLACAKRLHELGFEFLLVEASNTVGGRLKTDQYKGFLLDHGFQVLQTAYPEAQRVLKYHLLSLQPFDHGAQIQTHSGVVKRLYDPWRNPIAALQNAFSGIGTVDDKLLIGQLRKDLTSISVEAIYEKPDQTTYQYLASYGFSTQMIEGFLRPWFYGIFFEPDLNTSAKYFMFLFKMFAEGDASLPAAGMAAIPAQLLEDLPPQSVLLNTRVESISENKVVLANKHTLHGRAVVVAVEGSQAAGLTGFEAQVPVPVSRSVACIYFDAPVLNLHTKSLMLNGSGDGIISNLAPISGIAPTYAPPGRNLVSVSIVAPEGIDDPDLENTVRKELENVFNQDCMTWQHLKTYRIRHAVPAQPPGSIQGPGRRLLELPNGVIVAGDHRESASIHGALLSGRLAADRIAKRFSN